MNRRKFLASAVALACAPVVAQVTAKIPLAAPAWTTTAFCDPLYGWRDSVDYSGPLFNGEIGRYEGFRFIESPPPTRLERVKWALLDAAGL